MKQYNINFKEPVDWKKESSINPIFLAVAAGCGVILVVFILLGWLKDDIKNKENALLQLNDRNKAREEAVVKIKELKKEVGVLKSATDFLDYRERRRLVICNQLSHWLDVMPADTYFNSFYIRSQEVADKKVLKVKIPVKIRYSIKIDGWVETVQPIKTITDFSDSLANHNYFSKKLLLDSRKASPGGWFAKTKNGNESAKNFSFTLEVNYKPILKKIDR